MISKNQRKNITKLIYTLAGLYNFSILIFCEFFNKNLGKVDDLFNTNGVINIILWGMAYISISQHNEKLFLINFVFFIEKLFYFHHWITWILVNIDNLKLMFENDKMNFLFFSIYGIGDLLFGLFFVFIAYRSLFYKENLEKEKTKNN